MPGHLYAIGMAVGLDTLEGFKFNLDRPYTCCRICGEVYQSDKDRLPPDVYSEYDRVVAMSMRKAWSIAHAKTHPEREHLNLAMSGMWLTPEASIKLAAFGVIPISDLALAEGHTEALAEAKAVPHNDAEGA